MTLATLVYPYHAGMTRLTAIGILIAFVLLSIVWGRYLAPRLARRLPPIQFATLSSEATWRLVGGVAIAIVLLASTVGAEPILVIRDPCESCAKFWPDWWCWLNCVVF